MKQDHFSNDENELVVLIITIRWCSQLCDVMREQTDLTLAV